MTTYVESNFVMELVRAQEQHGHCEAVLRLGEQGATRLVLPAFSVAEPYETIIRDASRRQALAQNVEQALRELGRSLAFRDAGAAHTEFVAILSSVGPEELRRLDATIARLLAVCDLIPLQPDILASAIGLRSQYDLQPKDAIVCASVLHHLDTAAPPRSCLIARDRGFGDPDLAEALRSRGCKLFFDFGPAAQYLTSLSRDPGS